MGFIFTKLLRNIILLVVLFNAVNFYLKWKSYNISVKDFKTAASKSADSNAQNAISKFITEFRRTNKRHVPTELYWIPLSAGGLHLRAQFIYADLTEYVVVLAAGHNTVGRSGFHWSNNTCTVLTGEIVRYSDTHGATAKESFTGGQNFRHGQYESYIYQFKEGTNTVCYGRGFVPASGFWALIGGVSNGDPLSVGKLTYVYVKYVWENMVHSSTDMFHTLKDKATKFEL